MRYITKTDSDVVISLNLHMVISLRSAYLLSVLFEYLSFFLFFFGGGGGCFAINENLN